MCKRNKHLSLEFMWPNPQGTVLHFAHNDTYFTILTSIDYLLAYRGSQLVYQRDCSYHS